MDLEAILLERLREGDRSALEHVYLTHKNRLLTLALCLCADLPLAEDCLQDVFVRLADEAVAGRIREDLGAYLSSCVRNQVRDRQRRRLRRRRLAVETIPVPAAADGPADSLDRLAERQETERLIGLLGRLPYEQREVVVLHLKDGLTFRAIAEVQAVSINTVQSRYRYGIERLRNLMNEEVMR
jgi:RNA polymerase sigma-70 factor (ECF subfamily)